MRDFEYSVKEKLTCTYLLKNKKNYYLDKRAQYTYA